MVGALDFFEGLSYSQDMTIPLQFVHQPFHSVYPLSGVLLMAKAKDQDGDVFEPADAPRKSRMASRLSGPSEKAERLGDPLANDPSFVGSVIQSGDYLFVAHRSDAWGGTTNISSSIRAGRDFIQAACGTQVLRSELSALPDGTPVTYYYNNLFATP